jgi:hypothetical protein
VQFPEDEEMNPIIKVALARIVFFVTILFTLSLCTDRGYAQGTGLSTVGAVNPAHGFPQHYQDRSGVALEPCIVSPNDPTNPVVDPCILAGSLPAGDASEIVFPTNFPDEIFYNLTSSVISGIGGVARNRAVLTMALEGAFATGAVAEGQQIVFARFRLRVEGVTPGETYVLTYPYGVKSFQADPTGVINFTDDQGCLAAGCAFDSVLTSTNIGPFLQWDPAESAPPTGYVGDPNITHTVLGSPFNTNIFRLQGPNVGGAGIDVIETDQFAVMGKLYNGTVASALTVDRTSYSRTSPATAKISVFARSSGDATLIATGAGIPPTTLTKDPISGRFFAAILPTDATSLPAFIRITATAPNSTTVTRESALVDEVTVASARFDEASGVLNIQAMSSDASLKPALTASTSLPTLPLGALDATGTLVVNTTVPSSSITVTSSGGGSSTLPVTLVPQPITTTTTLSTSASSISSNQSVTLTAVVAAGTPVASGSVTFKDGTTTLGEGTIAATGSATLTVPANTLSPGTHALTAVFAGTTTFAGSVSAPVSVVVVAPPVIVATTTGLASSLNPARSTGNAAGRTVVFTATVRPSSGTALPTGTVTFRDGTVIKGTANLSTAGVATFTMTGATNNTGTNLAVGTHPITATYAGSATFAGSTSATLNQVIR